MGKYFYELKTSLPQLFIACKCNELFFKPFFNSIPLIFFKKEASFTLLKKRNKAIRIAKKPPAIVLLFFQLFNFANAYKLHR